ncbi:MAG TPA: hypothetical protein PLD33_14815 [Anaerolineales bacterium]|nr:hypothetical protein [Anaerolineales bacterium]HMV95827.1 hypothetical protein [Anaerolineales bacterium]HMX19820.1 hypothetical protein [Anaerolineales bacterium]HMZ43603.1 hypothetical protein [Anaerolineales bacterium]HNA54814.1 hypothetical protein [Anaerolineales bacterium]
MYNYPLKFEFPMISLGRQMDVKNGDGGFIMRVSDPYISFKDEMTVINGKGAAVMKAKGDSSFRFLFQFASTSTSWNIVDGSDRTIAWVTNYWARMEEFKDVYVDTPSGVGADGRADIGGVLGNIATNVLNNRVASTLPSRLVYKITDSEYGNVLGWVVPSRGTGWFDFLPYSTRIQILNLPFAARAYAPSYEFKLGNLYGPTVLKLQKQRDLLVDKYTLEKIGDLSEANERWALPSIALAAMFERQRVKEMADW